MEQFALRLDTFMFDILLLHNSCVICAENNKKRIQRNSICKFFCGWSYYYVSTASKILVYTLKVLPIPRMLRMTATTMKCTFRNELSLLFFEVCRNLYFDIFRDWHRFFIPRLVFSCIYCKHILLMRPSFFFLNPFTIYI